MDKIKLNDIDFTKLDKFSNQGACSTLYVEEKNCIKILDKMSEEEKASLYKKLLAFDDMEINNVIFPKVLVINNGKLEGYIMDFFENSSTLSDYFYSNRFVNCKDIFEALKKASFILRDIHNADIIYQDLSFQNILINNERNIKFIDIDSWSYQEYKSPFISPLLSDYIFYYRKDNFFIFSKNVDRISFMLSFFKLMYLKEIQKLSNRKYNSLAKRIVTLENAKLYANQLLYSENIPIIPYLDEIINDEDDYVIDRRKQLPIRKRILRVI